MKTLNTTQPITGTFPLADRPLYQALAGGHGGKQLKRVRLIAPCVYIITNTTTKQFYVGSTEDFFLRWRLHHWMLKNRRHKNTDLQASFDRYGAEAFVITIVEVVKEANEELELLERMVAYSLPERMLFNYRVGLDMLREAPGQDRPAFKTKRGKNSKPRWFDGMDRITYIPFKD